MIANCAECEPYITADYRRMLENPEELVSGMKVVLKLFDNAKGIFGVEDNKPDCIAKLKELTKDEPRMEVLALKQSIHKVQNVSLFCNNRKSH